MFIHWWWYAWILKLAQLSNRSQPSVHMQSRNPRHLCWTKMVIIVLIVIPIHMQSGGPAIHFGPKTSWGSHILFSKTSWSLVFSYIVLKDIMVIIVHHNLWRKAELRSPTPSSLHTGQSLSQPSSSISVSRILRTLSQYHRFDRCWCASYKMRQDIEAWIVTIVTDEDDVREIVPLPSSPSWCDSCWCALCML